MTHLRKMMLEELQRLNYAEATIETYIRAVKEFSQHFNCSPDRLGPRHIREYQAALSSKRSPPPVPAIFGLAPSAVVRCWSSKDLRLQRSNCVLHRPGMP